MKKAPLLISLLALLIAHTALAGDIYVFDKNHSTMGFLIRHLFTKVPGKFTDFSGQIILDEGNPEQSTVEVTIKTASVNTSNDARDKDLRSPDFFDVERFPEMKFKSKSVKRTGENTADVIGELTMHGVTREITLKVEFTGKGKGPGPRGKTMSGSKRYDDGVRVGCGNYAAAERFRVNLESNDRGNTGSCRRRAD
jgi:polyisoprenoid-binding protein YceI